MEGFPGIKQVECFLACRRFAFPQDATGEPKGQKAIKGNREEGLGDLTFCYILLFFPDDLLKQVLASCLPIQVI